MSISYTVKEDAMIPINWKSVGYRKHIPDESSPLKPVYKGQVLLFAFESSVKALEEYLERQKPKEPDICDIIEGDLTC